MKKLIPKERGRNQHLMPLVKCQMLPRVEVKAGTLEPDLAALPLLAVHLTWQCLTFFLCKTGRVTSQDLCSINE